MKNIKIGTMVLNQLSLTQMEKLVPYGFESFAIHLGASVKELNVAEFAKKITDFTEANNVEVSCISVFGNPLGTSKEDVDTKESWEILIDNAHLFKTNLVTGFAGRIPNESIDKSIPRYKEIFSELAKRAESKGVKLAFENCACDGTWNNGAGNIAMLPRAWDMMFEAVPSDNIGLEWEPCHQMVCLIDPIPQLRKYAALGKIFHIHGKDATIAWDVIKEHGIHGGYPYAWHRTPGFGDSNWADIISILRQNRYEGNIDIEGFHDPVYNGELEMSGQVTGLNYLKRCRGGDVYPNAFF